MRLGFMRLMVRMHHSFGTIAFVSVASLIAIYTGTNFPTGPARLLAYLGGLAGVILVFFAGVFIAPLDNREHQQGGCLLDKLTEDSRP